MSGKIQRLSNYLQTGSSGSHTENKNIWKLLKDVQPSNQGNKATTQTMEEDAKFTQKVHGPPKP